MVARVVIGGYVLAGAALDGRWAVRALDRAETLASRLGELQAPHTVPAQFVSEDPASDVPAPVAGGPELRHAADADQRSC